MPQHTSTSLNSAAIRTTYWTDTFGTSRQFVPVRTQVDVVRELHYKVGSILYKNCATYLQALQKVGLGMDLDSLTLSEDTKTYLDAEGINTIDQITNPNTYQCEISGVGGQWKATAISFLERFSQELYRMMPDADGAARQVAEAHKNAATIVAAGEKSVEQIKERLTLADKTIASLEKVIDKAGLTMPQECMCGEIRDKEGETQVVVITPKKQLEVQINGTTTKGVWMCPQDVEYGEGLTYETVEIYDGVEGEYTVELSRPTWFAHKGDEEEGCCRNCILGDTANKGKCSPCFDPNPSKSKLAIRMAGGTARFITGKLGRINKENISIKTPSADITIRGTDFTTTVDEIGRSLIILLPDEDGNSSGEITVATAAGIEILNKPFQATMVSVF